MNYKFPGLLSIILLFTAAGIANYQLYTQSFMLGAAFTVCFPLSLLNMLYHYCRKCPHVTRKTCRHVIFGWLVQKLFKPLKPSKYNVRDITLASLPTAIVMLISQYWLFKNKYLFIAFCVIMLIAVIIVRISLCKSCENTYCKLCSNNSSCVNEKS